MSSKLHLVCEGQGLPIQMLLTGGQINEITQASFLLGQCQLQLTKGRPRLKPNMLIADKGYDSQPFRRWLSKRGVKATIAERKLPEGSKRRRKGPKPTFDTQAYRQRNVIERLYGRIKEYRRIATRFDKLDKVYLCLVTLGFIYIILKKHFSNTP
ncbi:IS5 family transposase [Pontibacter pudoricolor]|uniref:IS5 family transposase n=1 Tax=Pontibacter pudoricolor TaxID=2694930 RepID=UPI003743B248